MPTTTLGLPYPDGGSPANVPFDLGRLAFAAENLNKELGIPRVASGGDEAALGAQVGRLCYRTDLKKHRIRRSAGWVDAVPHIATGAAPISGAGTMAGTGGISFGVTFAALPHVMTAQVITPTGVVLNTAVATTSTTGATLRWVTNSGTTGATAIPWLAIGWLT